MSIVAFSILVHMVVGYIKKKSKPPNDEKRSLLHLLAPHIRDKQYPWRPTMLTCQEIKHPIPQSSL
jgi:hypothetical protein